MMNEPLTQELKAITDYLDMIDPQWRTKIAATGAHGSMTVTTSDSMASPYARHDDVDGWVAPKDGPVNVRSDTRVDDSTYLYKLNDKALVKGSKKGGDGFTWYRISNSPDSYVREDVVIFTKDKPQPVVPHSSNGKWPSPIAGRYAIENTHLNHRNHKGVDLSAPMGTNIINHVDAFVLRAFDCVLCKPEGDGAWTINNNDYGDGYGTFAILRYDSWSLPSAAQQHVERFVFVLYGHMSDIDVTQGFLVRADSRIGRVGSTGNSSGPHLHLEVRTSDTPNVNFYSARLIDPALLFNL